MNSHDLIDQLQTDWPMPDWREILTTIRTHLGLLLIIVFMYSANGLWVHGTPHILLLVIPQILLGLLLKLVYYRSVIDPNTPFLKVLSRSTILLPFSIWILWLQTAAGMAGIFLFILPGIYIYARLMLAPAFVAADRPGISDHPLKASWKLTERRAGHLVVASVGMTVYIMGVMIKARHFGPIWNPSSMLLRGLLGLPAYLAWWGFTAVCAVHAIGAQPKDLLHEWAASNRPAGWETWIMRVLAGVGLFVVFVILMMGVGFLGTTSMGGNVLRRAMHLSGAGGNVVIHGKTVLEPPAPWIAAPEQPFPESQAVSFHLMALGDRRGAPSVRVAWLPVNAPPVMDQPTAQRLSSLVVRGMDALELQQAKALRKLYDLEQRELAEYRMTGLSIVQNPDPHGWVVLRTRTTPAGITTKRDRFMPWDGGLLVFSDTLYSWQDAQKTESQERPLLNALKL